MVQAFSASLIPLLLEIAIFMSTIKWKNPELHTAEAPNTSDPSHDLTIGRLVGTSFDYNGDIGEVVIYNKELSTSELTKIAEYLALKWG